jgi:hypothetical protein
VSLFSDLADWCGPTVVQGAWSACSLDRLVLLLQQIKCVVNLLAPQRPPVARRVYGQKDEIDDYDDPIFFSDPTDDEDELFVGSPPITAQPTRKNGTSTPYNTERLWAEVQAGR